VKGCDFNLPTAAQWEYACRASGAGDYSFGNDERKLDQYAWYSGNAGGQTHPVGKKKPNAWGLYDMHGNVWEWCREAYLPPYAPGAVSDPVGTSTGTFLLLRGGAWNSPPVFVRSAFNGNGPPGVRNNCLGLRVMMLAGAAR
jgi:formylglycine-generating enzyme required for sulfatase activity